MHAFDFARPGSVALGLEPEGVAPGALPDDEAEARGRVLRVWLLVIAAFLMGLVDLACTLEYMRNVGMFELNPIARALVAGGSHEPLVVYKFFTMGISAGLLIAYRRHSQAEFCAWLCASVLFALMIKWTWFNAMFPTMSDEYLTLATADPSDLPRQWVRALN